MESITSKQIEEVIRLLDDNLRDNEFKSKIVVKVTTMLSKSEIEILSLTQKLEDSRLSLQYQKTISADLLSEANEKIKELESELNQLKNTSGAR